MKKSSLLINEPPLEVLPSLAKAIGLNEAIVAQQLHYWLGNPKAGVMYDGHKWIFNTYEEWKDGNFPWWSVPTIQRIFSNLEKSGVVISAQLKKDKRDMRKYYRIDYDALGEYEITPSYQVDMMEHINLIPSHDSKLIRSHRINLIPSIVSKRNHVNNSNTETSSGAEKTTKNSPQPSSKRAKKKNTRKKKLIEGEGDSVLSKEQINITAYIENLPILFPPDRYGHLEVKPSFMNCHPSDVLGWITKAYDDRDSLVRGGGAIGLIVKRLTDMTPADPYYLDHASTILPIPYLEVIGLYDVVCQYCDYVGHTRAEINTHLLTDHRVTCEECGEVFLNKQDERRHYDDEHDPERVKVTSNNGLDAMWDDVLTKLQMEMPRASFDTWVRDTRPISHVDGVLTVSVRNAYAQDWLETRLAGTVSKLLNGDRVNFVTPKREAL